MGLITKARNLRDETIKNHPELKEDVIGLYQLMLDEIEEGNSINNEIEAFEASIEDLINENM
jgi:hypothetical protein